MNRKMISKKFQKTISILLSLLIALIILMPNIAYASDSNKLETKIAKGYSSKFCNAIGIGISKESALRMTISENANPKYNTSLWFELLSQGKKNISSVNDEEILELVSTFIVEECGYPLGIKGEKGREEIKSLFEKSYYQAKINE